MKSCDDFLSHSVFTSLKNNQKIKQSLMPNYYPDTDIVKKHEDSFLRFH